MNLTELKQKPIAELLETAHEMGLENISRSRKQDIIFVILKKHAKNGEDIYGDGVLEILQDGFGFLRSADSSYLAGPDDIYVSPSQIRRFNLRTGDTVAGKIRPPKDGERYFALLKISEINFSKPESSKNKILFENLTPLFPQDRLELQLGNGSTEDLSARVIDLTAPIGKGQRGLIVSPPKAGKTLILQNIAQSPTHILIHIVTTDLHQPNHRSRRLDYCMLRFEDMMHQRISSQRNRGGICFRRRNICLLRYGRKGQLQYYCQFDHRNHHRCRYRPQLVVRLDLYIRKVFH